jgi:hypothetical protein
METFQDRFIKALENKIPNSRCPLCQSSDWAVQPGVYRFRQGIRTDSSVSYGDALSSAALVCNVCGDIQFISLEIFGDAFKRDMI